MHINTYLVLFNFFIDSQTIYRITIQFNNSKHIYFIIIQCFFFYILPTFMSHLEFCNFISYCSYQFSYSFHRPFVFYSFQFFLPYSQKCNILSAYLVYPFQYFISVDEICRLKSNRYDFTKFKIVVKCVFQFSKMSLFERFCNKVEYIYREYEFLTATCVMDVWERRMVNLTLVRPFFIFIQQQIKIWLLIFFPKQTFSTLIKIKSTRYFILLISISVYYLFSVLGSVYANPSFFAWFQLLLRIISNLIQL